MTIAINTLLWSPTLGAYSIALTDLGDISILATAFAVRTGIANSSQATSSIALLPQIFYGIGYKETLLATNSSVTQLSPNTQGPFLSRCSLRIAHSEHH